MDLFYFCLILFALTGVILVIYASFSFGAHKREDTDDEDYLTRSIETKLDGRLQRIDSSVAEADSAINELTKASSSMMKQLDDKYSELLFLYGLIDKKKEEILREAPPSQAPPIPEAASQKSERAAFILKNPKYQKIRELADSGMNVTEIAKALNIGKAEIEMVLSLSRG